MRFDAFARAASHASGSLASIAVLMLTLSVVYDVVMRYLFTAPTTWGLEYSEYLMVAIVYLGLAPALRNGKHVMIDLVTQSLSEATRRRLRLALHVLAVPYVAVLLWQAWELTRRSFVDQRVSQYVSGTPLAIPQAIIVLGCALLLVELIARILADAGVPVRGAPGQPSGRPDRD
jgi:TRAP-type C4-dicarboxylate transport system permease small subunit